MHGRENRKDCSEVSNTSSAMMNGSVRRMLEQERKRDCRLLATLRQTAVKQCMRWLNAAAALDITSKSCGRKEMKTGTNHRTQITRRQTQVLQK